MIYPISTTGRPSLAILAAAVLAAAVLAVAASTTPAFAQQQTTDQGNQQEAGGTLTPEEAFSGGIERTGVVGQSTAAPVGASAASTANSAGAGGTGGRSTFGGGFGGGMGAAFGNLFNNNANSSSSSTPPIRTRLRSGVQIPAGTMANRVSRQVSAQSRFQSAGTLQPRGQGLAGVAGGYAGNPYSGVNVQLESGTAVLQGSVASEKDRRMSELLMRLEPGVSSVQNRISVAP
ncbi:BON domain-containing protein [Rhodopirellula sallentina]|nr:BON domain-containing protein [Rhodopirellula sallentina]